MKSGSPLLFVLALVSVLFLGSCTISPVADRYKVYLPDGYSPRKSWPLLLFLHGYGERGRNLQLVARHGPPKLIESGRSLPFIVVAPQSESGWWDTGFLNNVLSETTARYQVDENRIYLTGMSLGGYGVWSMAKAYPDRFAAIAPVCGGGNPNGIEVIKSVPVWAFHGEKDQRVPLSAGEEMVNALRAAGGNVRFTVYANTGHDSWTETYNNPQLYEWLLKQSR